MGDRLPRLIAVVAVACGLCAALAGASVLMDAWTANQALAGSSGAHPDAEIAQTPIWLDDVASGSVVLASPDLPRPASALTAPVAPIVVASPAIGDASLAAPVPTAPPIAAAPIQAGAGGLLPPSGSAQLADADVQPDIPVPVSEAVHLTAAPAEIEVAEVDFRFLDPPEPGAHARIAVQVANRADVSSDLISVTLLDRWLNGFEVLGAIPDVVVDRSGDDGSRHFVFGGLGAHETRTVEVHLLAAGEQLEAPEVRVLLGDDSEIIRTRPRTIAPRPRPGPASGISIPRLGVRAPVIPVLWEPPSFVVGQLQGSAVVSLGNTVLIGHLAGPWGDVFARLDRLRPGDDVVAISRGLEYRFIVSEVAVRPYDDVSPTLPTDTPRLSMMTCTGQWSIFRQDYSHRLWVVAEPPELAQQTIRANAERAAAAAIEAEAAAAARATHEAELDQTAPLPPAPTPSTDVAPPEVPASDAPAPSAVVASLPPDLADDGDMLVPGLAIDAPSDQAAVSRRLLVRGRRLSDAVPGSSLWLAVRAAVEGSRWYLVGHPLAVRADGTWQAEVDLGGPTGIDHEIRVGFADADLEIVLRRHVAERAGQPLDELPTGFQTGAKVVVRRAP